MTDATVLPQTHRDKPRPRRRSSPWVRRTTVVIFVLLLIGVLEFLQQLMLGYTPLHYQHLMGAVRAALVLAVVILYFRWRRYAVWSQNMLQSLQQAERWREDMTAMLVHDLKNPVISSTLALQAILRRQKRAACLSDEEMEYLRMAQESQVRLSNMIGDLMTIAQAESGSIPLQLERVDLCAIATKVVQEMRPQAEKRQLDLQHECGESVRLLGDRFRLRRVVENLLGNAIKFTPAGGQIRVSVLAQDGSVELRVSDTGQGISSQDRERIFHKFGQAVTGTRMSIGLGLTFCKLIAEAHGGSIGVESEPGRGSTFIVRLPKRLDEPAPAGPPSAPAKAEVTAETITQEDKDKDANNPARGPGNDWA